MERTFRVVPPLFLPSAKCENDNPITSKSGDEMKTLSFLLAFFTAVAVHAQQSQYAAISLGSKTARLTYDYTYHYWKDATFSDADAAKFLPYTSYFNAFPSLFVGAPYASTYQEGDIIVMGPSSPKVAFSALTTGNGHAAYVLEIQTSNTPDGGNLRMSPTGIWRDDDPIVDDNHVIVQQISSEGTGPGTSTTVTLAQLKSQRPNDEVYGVYKLRDDVKEYTVTFQNSFSGGKILVGKNKDGDFLNADSPNEEKYTVNTSIPARAISPQKVGATTYAFNDEWTNTLGQYATTQAIQVTVSADETYTATFYTSSTGALVVFQNYADGENIGSIIKVDGEDQISTTPQFPLGVTAEAYSYLKVNRVVYSFSHWSTSSTNVTFQSLSDNIGEKTKRWK